MSASIRVESGISAGTSFWIDRPVLRIGSDPQCDICLPTAELAPHALTLEFRGGTYRIYNRGTAPVTAGSAMIQPGANGIWNDGDSIVLPGNQQLRLAFDGDPQPSPRPESRRDGFEIDEQAAPAGAAAGAVDEAAAKKKSSSSMVQMAVIGLCVLGMAAFLTMGGGDDAAKADRPTFEGIVEATLAADKDDPMREFLPRLQYAQAGMVRGHRELAKQRFLKLRDQLVRQSDTLPEKGQEGAKRMLDYVEFRLSQLQ